jgi:hypothetical protein
VGAFITAFLSLIGVVVWALKQQLGQSQKIIETLLPAQQITYINHLDKMSETAIAQIDKLAAAYSQQLLQQADFFKQQVANLQIFMQQQAEADRKIYLGTLTEVLVQLRLNQESIHRLSGEEELPRPRKKLPTTPA